MAKNEKNIKSLNKLKITFLDGTRTVTGSNFLVENDGVKILVDCGLIQGSKLAEDQNWLPFAYNPKDIDYLLITHSHIDHIGRIPKLIAEGFNGKIYSTPPTKDLAHLMLDDTKNILEKDEAHNLKEIYTSENILKAMDLWQTMPYGHVLNIGDGFGFSFRDSGHILGSAMIEIGHNHRRIVFTGDLGNSPSPLLRDTEELSNIDYLIMESVYGDRNHEARDDRKKELEQVLEDNYKKRGTLVIPTFSLERTQELLFEIDDLIENKRIPKMTIFLDSPLAIKLTKVYKKYQDYFNKKTQLVIGGGEDIFNFPGLKETLKTEESKNILNFPNPKVIIAGSGMSSGGRIVHHEKNYLSDPNSILLLTGYQAPGTMGRLIEEGAKTVKIGGDYIPVRSKVVNIKGYSGHKDSDHLILFVSKMKETLKKVFVVVGEPSSSMFLAQKIKDNLGLDAIVPEVGQVVEI